MGKVTCGCVLESTPTWFLVGTIECSCGTGRTNFPRPDVKYSVRERSLENASLARPTAGNTWTLFFCRMEIGILIVGRDEIS